MSQPLLDRPARVAVAGTAWELTHSVAEVKATQLLAIGIDPTAAITINLVYSAAAFGVFGWIAARRWTGHGKAGGGSTRPGRSKRDKPTSYPRASGDNRSYATQAMPPPCR
jgi:hypothetical protein